MHDLLTAQQEIDLARRRDAGDPTAIHTLVEQNDRLAHKISKPFIAHLPREGDDILAMARLGLVEAAQRFDPDRGCRFSTMATWWVRRAIMEYVREDRHLIRVPAYLQSKSTAARAKQPFLEAAARAIALEAGRSPRDDSHQHLAQIVAQDEQRHPEALELERLQSALNQLHKRHRFILGLRLGLDGAEPMTLTDIGAAEGISKERVRQIEAKAMAKLRQIMLGTPTLEGVAS